MTPVHHRHGGYLMPDDVRLALHAAVDDPGDAMEAWDQMRATVDLDTCWDPDIMRVLPLVWRNLVASGVNHPDLARLAGVHRHNWYAGRQTLEAVGGACHALELVGVPFQVVGGASMVARCYDGPGDRPVDDTALVVHPDDLERASVILAGAGWVTAPGRRSRPASTFAVPRRLTRADVPGVGPLTLVVTPNPWCSPTPARKLAVHATATATANWPGDSHPAAIAWVPVSAEVQLMVTLLGGPTAVARHGHAWMVDVVHLVRSGAVNADALVHEASRQGVGPLLVPGLESVASEFGVSVGDGVTGALARAGATRRARWAATSSSSNRLMGLAARWARATHNQAVLTAVASAPAFMVEQFGVDGPGALPAEFARRLRGVDR
jgi:hypothetical protein